MVSEHPECLDSEADAKNDPVARSVLFPDLSLFEDADHECEPEEHVLTPWAKAKIGTFQARLEDVLQKRELRNHNKFRHGIDAVSSSLLINMVNESFGFNGWSSEILECRILSQDFDENDQKFSMAQEADVRVTLSDGTEVEATGQGKASNLPLKHTCLATSRKMACTDGLRKAFLKFPELLASGRSIKIEDVVAI